LESSAAIKNKISEKEKEEKGEYGFMVKFTEQMFDVEYPVGEGAKVSLLKIADSNPELKKHIAEAVYKFDKKERRIVEKIRKEGY